ncbi:MAG: hypothetical protein ACIAXF_15310 [Phycisphaerales bacterium JB063]
MSMHPDPGPRAPAYPAPVPPATPESPTAWVFRAGPQVVLVQGGNLPERCVRCNQPLHGKPIKKTMYWHDPMWFLLILAGILIYAIVAVCIRKKVKVSISLCQEHKRQRMIWNMLLVVGLIGGVMLAITGAVMESGLIAIVGGLLFLFGLVSAVMASSGALRPTFIDERVARLKGAKEPFLASLPDWPYN